MSLLFAEDGKEYSIQRISGSIEIRKHLADLGFRIGEFIRVITHNKGNYIVSVQNVRVALGKDMASKVWIVPGE